MTHASEKKRGKDHSANHQEKIRFPFFTLISASDTIAGSVGPRFPGDEGVSRYSRYMVVAVTFLLQTGVAYATSVSDFKGDYLTSLTGSRNADLDILSASVTFYGSTFVLSAMTAGPITDTPGQLYVSGIMSPDPSCAGALGTLHRD